MVMSRFVAAWRGATGRASLRAQSPAGESSVALLQSTQDIPGSYQLVPQMDNVMYGKQVEAAAGGHDGHSDVDSFDVDWTVEEEKELVRKYVSFNNSHFHDCSF